VLDLQTFVPSVMRLTGGSPKGDDNERRVLEAVLEKDHLYVVDRGYFDRKLLERIVAIGSSYVFRVQENIQYEVIEQRPLSAAAIANGVLSDQVVRLAGMAHPTRLVIVKAEVHSKRTRNGYIDSSGQMLLLCNDLSLEPQLVSLLYRYRWTIEIFFKFFKQLLGCRHLISQRKNGVQIQAYCAMIACMLRSGEAYGYQLLQRLAADPLLSTTESTLYPVLSRLADEKLVSVRQAASPSGPPRRYYRLTVAGQKHLDQLIGYWGEFSGAVNQLINTSLKGEQR
jgi:DNA-binding PadR family transcriptional regulator